MPLSEQELRTLEQLEAQLSAEDPKFASAMNSDPARRRRRQRAAVISGVVVLGFGLVIAGAFTKLAWLGLLGAVVLAGGAMYALQSPSRPDLGVVDASGRVRPRGATSRGRDQFSVTSLGGSTFGASSGRPQAATRRGGTSPFMDRMEERWERRRRENQGW